MRHGASVAMALLLLVIGFLSIRGGTVSASHTCAGGAAVCGELGPLIPFHKDAIHAALVWSGTKGWHRERTAKICFWMRPTEYRGSDLVDPDLAPGPLALESMFGELVYGGFGFSIGPNGLDESVASRIKVDIPLDNGLCLDLTHPDAFRNTGKFSVADLTEADFALNAAAFSNAGHSRGLNYNIFCSGNVALTDGRLLFVGGHDKTGNHGLRKLNIFDPQTQRWVKRPVPEVKRRYLADPTGSLFPHPNPQLFARDEAHTDPPHPSDMKYQRWYPTAVTLPDGTVLILSGTDQDSSLGPPGTQFAPPCTDPPTTAACSKYRILTPEVYDPKKDRTIALENAMKFLSMYPPSYVVQTGRRKHDWKVAVIGEVEPPLPSVATLGQYDPWAYSGKTYLFDVRAALKDRNRETPGEKHWEHVATAQIAHESAAAAHLVELDHEGWAISQRVVLFGGSCGTRPAGFPCDRRTVEMIDFQDANPQWILQQPLIQGATQNGAVPLPTGKVLVFGGGTGRGALYQNSFHYQIFDPSTGSMTPVVQTTVPRQDHQTGLLLPDATVIAMGSNRTDVVPGDPLAVPPQPQTQAQRNAGVPVAQIYKPPYLFNGEQPVIEWAFDKISYGRSFTVKVSKGSGSIGSVAIIRQDPQSHTWGWGNRYVKLSFTQKGPNLLVRAPAAPGLAIPGYYMLFVLNDEGVPSVASLVHLDGGRGDHDGDHDHEVRGKR